MIFYLDLSTFILIFKTIQAMMVILP
eukprot:COSAG03_NODE_24631_length_271_cov_0.593023_1_plen_25_part_01